VDVQTCTSNTVRSGSGCHVCPASRYFSRDVAFLSATLYIFLPRTYQIISRNTRTGAAIFFTAFLLLVILDTDIPDRFRRFLVITFFWGVITSHYGIGPLVVFALVVAYLLNIIASSLLENKRPSQLWLARVALFGTLIVVWYAFLTNGTFYFIANSLYNQISGSLFFTQSSTAVRSIELASETTGGAFGMPSGSYEVIFVGHLLLGVFTSIGISLVYLRYFGHGIPYLFDIQKWIDRNVFPELSDDVLEDSNYVHLAFGMFLFFPLSFGPQVLSAGRTFALVMVIVAPFPILVLQIDATQENRIETRNSAHGDVPPRHIWICLCDSDTRCLPNQLSTGSGSSKADRHRSSSHTIANQHRETVSSRRTSC